jgi:hypothetical protein
MNLTFRRSGSGAEFNLFERRAGLGKGDGIGGGCAVNVKGITGLTAKMGSGRVTGARMIVGKTPGVFARVVRG